MSIFLWIAVLTVVFAVLSVETFLVFAAGYRTGKKEGLEEGYMNAKEGY